MNTPTEDEHGSEAVRELERRIFELSSLVKAGRALYSILSPSELYDVILAIIAEKLQAGPMALFRFDADAKECVLVRSRGLTGVADKSLRFVFEEGLLWQNVLQVDPFSVTSASGTLLFERFFTSKRLDTLKTDLWAPLFLKDRLIGLLTLGRRADGSEYHAHDIEFLKQFAATAAASINTCNLYTQREQEKNELSRTVRHLSMLYDIGRAMTHISDLKELLGYILDQAIGVAGAEKGSIMLYDHESDLLQIRVIEGMDDAELQTQINNFEVSCRAFRPGEGVAGHVFQSGEPLVINSTKDAEEFVFAQSSFVRSIACIPMKVFGEVIGVINVTNKRGEDGFADEDMSLLEAIADQAAVAINKAQLWQMAVTDSLTGLYIRRYFLSKFGDELRRSQRFGHTLSVIMCDIDLFKRVNDTYGHEVGDTVLKGVAEVIQRDARTVDVTARFGGEEFAMLLIETGKNAAIQAAERFRSKIAELELGPAKVTVSFGVATFPEDADVVEGLIKKADIALYNAKKAGRDCVVSYEEGMIMPSGDGDEGDHAAEEATEGQGNENG